ncbi:MAG: rod shape-determining protein MreD [Clostridia bacterium]|nr:rod shape-determining protein MreD [Clostridia bacterium]
MRYILRVLLFLIVITLDTTLMPACAIGGGFPLLSLACVLCVAMIGGPMETVITGAAVGAVLDLLYQPIFGLNMLLYMYIALAVWAVYQYVYTKNVFMACLYAFVGTFIYQGLYALFSFRIFGQSVPFFFGTLIRAAENMILMIPLYFLYQWIAVYFHRKETL